MAGQAFAPGVAEALAAGEPKPAVAPPPAAPRFIGGAARSTTISLDWPVEYDGVVYEGIVLRRLTTDEVAKFLDKINGQPADAKVTFPVFRTADDSEIPDEVLSALDDDDMTKLNEAAASFLPRRFRAAPESDSSPLNGGSTAP
jgi:hypothetical protein